MKRIFKIAAFALLVMLGGSIPNNLSAQYDNGPQYDYDNDRDVSYQTFYDELSPNGQWIDYPGQGYVWVPNAGPDFRPYSTNGHWVWTDNYEWMWVSDYDWGWAPFHYGRWDFDPYYGWYWVPGYEWSPAWVAWRDGGDYYGWAPIRPGINISINFNIGGYSPPYDFWCFAPRRYITSPRIYDYCVDRRQNITIINRTTIIVNNFRYDNHYGFRSGPSRYEVERYTGRINPVRFRTMNTPGRTQFRNNEVSVYRPNIRRDNNRQFAPRQFERYDRSTARNNDNGFRTNGNTNRSSDNAGTRGNNLPGRDGRVDNNPGRGRDNNDFRQQRGNTNDAQNPRTDERRMTRPDRVPDQQTNNDRRIERQNGNNGPFNAETRNNEAAQRRQQQQMERRQQPQQVPQQMERRQEQRQPQQMERRQQQAPPQMERRPEQRQPQQMERRQQQAPPQVERRQEQRQPQQQESRSADRRENGGERQQGNGNGRKRF